MISDPDPERLPPEVIADPDGRAAAERALARPEGHRTAVWVGDETDPELQEFRAEIGRRP